ncbi:MAG: enoyl-CoA hydratase/isomerase family protein [Mycobacteriales bacterium]
MTAAREVDVERTESVVYDCRDGVAFVTMARPEARNALSPALLDGLWAACSRAVLDGARALVLTGAGRSFCAGGDLSGVHEAMAGDDVVGDIEVLVDQLHEVITLLRGLPMATVAAVNGSAIGAGIALALACDVRVVSTSTSFVTGYLAVGATPDGGSSFHLARALGAPQALAAFLTNRRIAAPQLLDAGLADALVPDDEVCDAAAGLARALSGVSLASLCATRELVYGASGHTLAEHLDAEKSHFLAIAQTPEFRAAVAPFARRPTAVART